MTIKIFPSDIVQMSMWDTYVYYVVGSEKEAEIILKENKEFELLERDALVIGLLKIIETDNLIHRFNDYFIHLLTVKSIRSEDEVFLKKKSLEIAMEKFLDKFPPYWTPPLSYKRSLEDLIKYIDIIKEKISKLDVRKITVQNMTYEVYLSSAIKKTLNFNNY